jgi:hypothetical protein
MRYSLAIFSVMAGATYAQDVVSFVFPGGTYSHIHLLKNPITNHPTGYDGADPVATIESVNPSTTQFKIACPTGTDSSDCGWGTGLDYTVISGTRYQAQMSAEDVSMSLGCDYNSQAANMVCTVNQGGGNDDTSGPVTATLTGSEISFISATVVEGASLLSGGAATATGAPVSSAARASSGLKTASGSAPSASRTSGSGASASISGSAPVTASTGAAARFGVEGSALVVLAGAAALML